MQNKNKRITLTVAQQRAAAVKALQQLTPKASKRPRSQRDGARSSEPVSVSVISRTRGPRIRASESVCIFTRRELIGSFTGDASPYQAGLSFPLNPGLSSFGTAGDTAKSWERYKFRRLRFHWIPSSPTTTAGNLMMYIDYDPTDEAPLSEISFSQNEGAVESSLFKELWLDADPKKLFGFGGPKFIRSGYVSDLRTSDAGNFFLAFVNAPVQALGRLYVDYEIEFTIAASTVPRVPISTQFYLATAPGQAMVTATPLPVTWTSPNRDPFGIVYSISGITPSATLTIPAGAWVFEYALQGTCSNLVAGFIVYGAAVITGANGDLSGDYLQTSTMSPSAVAFTGYCTANGVGIVTSSVPWTLTLLATLTGSGTVAIPPNAAGGSTLRIYPV